MALKDWRKAVDTKHKIVFDNIEKNITFFIFKNINGYSAGRYYGPRKQFKTKSQALKFAKAYMIKH